jgi:hypothetical protein
VTKAPESHFNVLVAVDVFVVPTIRLQVVYVFLVFVHSLWNRRHLAPAAANSIQVLIGVSRRRQAAWLSTRDWQVRNSFSQSSAPSRLVDRPQSTAQVSNLFITRRLRPCGFLQFEKGSALGRQRDIKES